jgi:hypothetical protein
MSTFDISFCWEVDEELSLLYIIGISSALNQDILEAMFSRRVNLAKEKQGFSNWGQLLWVDKLYRISFKFRKSLNLNRK